MIDLPEVTLACVDSLSHALALRALDRSRERIRFARALLFTDRMPGGIVASEGVDIVPIGPLASRDAYSQFVLKRLLPYIDTPHVLLVQWDGYVVNAEAWDDAFAQVDYIGAKWFWHADGHDVGNGGFSLRSRRLLEALQDSRIELVEAEDTTIGRTFRSLLEREHGIRFANAAMADRFAFEAAYPIGRPFGFHGLYNFCRVMPPAELAGLAAGFSDAILRSPQLAQLLRNCVALGQWQPAIAIAKRMLALNRGDTEVAALLAQCEAALARGAGIGRNDPCPCGSGKRFKHCHGAAGGSPAVSSPDALVTQALAAHQRGDLASASADYRAALAIAPEHPHAMHYLGVVAYQQGRPAEALPRLERAAALLPHEPEFHNNLGLVLAALDRPADAAAAHRRALAHKPDHAGAWNNLGLALHAQMDVDAAIDAFRHALMHAPGFTQARWNLALALLATGHFAEGWDAYESRLAIAGFAPTDVPATPRWDGHDANGRTILLKAEQGLGDAIQFVRLARTLAERGARVIVQCPRPLLHLFAQVEGVSQAVASGQQPPPHDAWLPLLSLAGILGIDATNIPANVPYLRADAALEREVHDALAPYASVMRVGLAWTGNRANTNDRRRSIPLATLAPLLDLPGIRWFSLQKDDDADPGNRPAELDRLARLPWRNDFDGIAAMMDELDLVVTVDTSIAHLAGALARPVFILLPFSSDWRWRTSRTDSDWYPTARLFRQPAPGEWQPVAAVVRDAIHARVGARKREAESR
jgi:tetratricopeptide (TPR) repeat protein